MEQQDLGEWFSARGSGATSRQSRASVTLPRGQDRKPKPQHKGPKPGGLSPAIASLRLSNKALWGPCGPALPSPNASPGICMQESSYRGMGGSREILQHLRKNRSRFDSVTCPVATATLWGTAQGRKSEKAKRCRPRRGSGQEKQGARKSPRSSAMLRRLIGWVSSPPAVPPTWIRAQFLYISLSCQHRGAWQTEKNSTAGKSSSRKLSNFHLACMVFGTSPDGQDAI